MVNKNEEDPISQAESIFEEARQGKDKDFSVVLPSGIVRKIVSYLNGKCWITKETNEESLLLVLLRKAIKVVVTDPQTGLRLQRGAVYPDIISISLNEREIDFLNALLLEEINASRRFIEEKLEESSVFYDEETRKVVQGVNLCTLTSDLSVFRELNSAFIKAGGNLRPEFRQFYEG